MHVTSKFTRNIPATFETPVRVATVTSGEDTLIDGTGEDILYGGTDRDHFVFIADGETDYIRDFDRETIDLTHFGTGLTYDDLSISNVNERYTIGFANEVLIVDIIIQNQYSNLNESHFLFAT